MKYAKHVIASFIILIVMMGCATFRTEVTGHSGLKPSEVRNSEMVDVLFISRHLVQTKGLDAIPKLQYPHQIIRGYDDMLLDAQHEFSNLNRYAAYTEFASDMSDPKRIALKDSLLANYEMRIVMEWKKEKTFSKYFLGTIGSVISLTLIPIPYEQRYSLEVTVQDGEGRQLKHYQRSGSTRKWVEFFLVPVYPFHTEMRKTEELYVAFLRDVFREIEQDQVLKPQAEAATSASQ